MTEPEEGKLTRKEKRIMTSLYTVGRKIQATKSHIDFLKVCQNEKLIPNGFKIKENRFQSSQEKQGKVILELVKLEETEFEGKLKILQKSFKKNMYVLRAKYSPEFYDRVMSKVDKSNKNYEKKVL